MIDGERIDRCPGILEEAFFGILQSRAGQLSAPFRQMAIGKTIESGANSLYSIAMGSYPRPSLQPGRAI
jgi:hypothetical protein